MSKDRFPIENGVPYPGKSKRHYSQTRAAYPFADLNVGESFFVPSAHEKFSLDRKICSAFHHARERTRKNFVWTREDGGFRIHLLEGGASFNPRRRCEAA